MILKDYNVNPSFLLTVSLSKMILDCHHHKKKNTSEVSYIMIVEANKKIFFLSFFCDQIFPFLAINTI